MLVLLGAGHNLLREDVKNPPLHRRAEVRWRRMATRMSPRVRVDGLRHGGVTENEDEM